MALLSLPPASHATPLGLHRAPGWALCYKAASHYYLFYFTHASVYVNATFSIGPTLSFPCCVKSIFYVCISISSL